MTSTNQAVGLPTSSEVLCTTYALIAIAALIATWSQNLAYLDRGADFMTAFWEDTKVNPASRSITVDILLFALAATVLMVVEARKHGVRFVWLYIVGAFLIAREVRVGRTESSRLSTADAVGLIVLALFTAAFTIWVDVV